MSNLFKILNKYIPKVFNIIHKKKFGINEIHKLFKILNK